METNKRQLTGIKKRQQISDANRMIFVWVIVASIAISLCGVTVQFLFRQAAFNQKIISAKLEAQSTLDDNLENVTKLKENVDALLANTNLAKVKANQNDTTLKVVLDALPTEDDKSALGASLQQVILPKSKVSTTDLTTIAEGSATDEDALSTETVPTSPFNFTVTSNYDRVKDMLMDLEDTIRPMNVKTLVFQSADNRLRVTVGGVTYYLPEQTVQLGKRTIQP